MSHNLSVEEIFLDFGFESLIADSMSGFNLCLIMAGCHAPSWTPKIETPDRTLAKRVKSPTPFLIVDTPSQVEPGMALLVFEAIFRFIAATKSSTFTVQLAVGRFVQD